MPLYEYHCTACGADFEHLSRRAGEAAPACGCGSGAVERIPYSRVAVAVKSPAAGAGPCAGGMGEGCCGGACNLN